MSDEIPDEHACECKGCGEVFDMRHLDQVMAHEHDGPHEATGIVGQPAVPDNLVRKVNFEILKELNQNPKAHYLMGLHRCCACGYEHQAMQEVFSWAAVPFPGECDECGELACLFVDDDEFKRIVPEAKA